MPPARRHKAPRLRAGAGLARLGSVVIGTHSNMNWASRATITSERRRQQGDDMVQLLKPHYKAMTLTTPKGKKGKGGYEPGFTFPPME